MGGQDPLTAAQVVGAIPLWTEPRLQGGRLFWLERRPQDGGRTRLLMRPAGPLDLPDSPNASPFRTSNRLFTARVQVTGSVPAPTKAITPQVR